jgi:hypothetical protein
VELECKRYFLTLEHKDLMPSVVAHPMHDAHPSNNTENEMFAITNDPL